MAPRVFGYRESGKGTKGVGKQCGSMWLEARARGVWMRERGYIHAASVLYSVLAHVFSRLAAYSQCRITNVGGLVQNFSGGLFSRRMGAPFPEKPVAFYFVSLRSSVQKD